MRIEQGEVVIRSATVDDAIRNILQWEGKLSQLCLIEIQGKQAGELSYRVKDDGTAWPGWKICVSDYQNQGYGTKIILMLFDFLFSDKTINSRFPIEKIIWDTDFENKRAQTVYENKIKARKIGIRENAWKDQSGTWRSAVDYEISRDDFIALHRERV